MNTTDANAIWDRALTSYHRDSWAMYARVALAPNGALLESYYTLSRYGRAASAPPATLFGLTLRIDPTLAPDELRLEAAGGHIIRLVNIGATHEHP